MELRMNVILRSAQRARLEGRTKPAYAGSDPMVKLARVLQ